MYESLTIKSCCAWFLMYIIQNTPHEMYIFEYDNVIQFARKGTEAIRVLSNQLQVRQLKK